MSEYQGWGSVLVVLVAVFGFASPPAAPAAIIGVKNRSYEKPNSLLHGGVYPEANAWMETGPVDGPPPNFPGFTVPDGGPFTLDTGVFFNSPISNPSFVTNARGNQLAYMFAKDDIGVSFQQQLATNYEADRLYTLTVGVGRSFFLPPINTGGGDPMMELRLFYEDDIGQHQTVVNTVVPASPLGNTMLTDFQVTTGLLSSGDPAIGRAIGIGLFPTQGTSGVWIFDHVRLTGIPEPSGLGLTGAMIVALTWNRSRRSSTGPPL